MAEAALERFHYEPCISRVARVADAFEALGEYQSGEIQFHVVLLLSLRRWDLPKRSPRSNYFE